MPSPVAPAFLAPALPARLPPSKRTRLTPTRPAMSYSTSVGDVPAKAAEAVLAASRSAIAERGTFSVAISGGSLPKLLAAGLTHAQLPLDKWNVFLADERIVPLTDDDSNFRLVKQYFPDMHVVPIDPTLSPPECARDYQRKIVDKLGEAPVFDAVLLGLGPDGHTCSLFPGHELVRGAIFPSRTSASTTHYAPFDANLTAIAHPPSRVSLPALALARAAGRDRQHCRPDQQFAKAAAKTRDTDAAGAGRRAGGDVHLHGSRQGRRGEGHPAGKAHPPPLPPTRAKQPRSDPRPIARRTRTRSSLARSCAPRGPSSGSWTRAPRASCS